MSDKSDEAATVSAITWYVNVDFNVGSSISLSEFAPSSCKRAIKASFVGANTVKGAGDVSAPVLRIEGKSVVKSGLVKAASKISRFSSAFAKVTIVGSGMTLLTACTIPFSALTALVIIDSPLRVILIFTCSTCIEIFFV